jgi:L-cystine transport system ATP-binding protein
MSDTVIEVTGLRKSYGKMEVLKGVDLAVAQGEVVALLGPSGSGKTTLLRCLNFLARADAGVLRIGGQSVDLRRATGREMHALRLQTAMVFQNYDLLLNMTVLQNVTAGLTVARRVPKPEARETAVRILTQVGLGDRLDSRPYELSGGQQQRVGIARALALNPAVLLFDEPTSALDPEKVSEILELIREVATSGVTMIVVTHEMAFAYEVAHRIVFMEEGEIVEQGDPKQVFGAPREERTRQFLSRFTFSRSPEYFI